MYILLTGKAPYFGNDDEKIIAQAKKGVFNRKLLIESNISKQALTIVDKLLNKDQKQRLSAEEAIQNPWIQKRMLQDTIDKEVQLKIMNNLRTFRADLKMQQAVLTFMIHQLISAKEMEEQIRMFSKLDVNKDGMLQREELIAGFKEIYGEVQEEEVDEIMALADLNGNGELDYSEWLVATLNRKDMIN